RPRCRLRLHPGRVVAPDPPRGSGWIARRKVSPVNVLCVVTHPDDEILGCGGTLRELPARGDRVSSCVLCPSAGARHARPDLARLQQVSKEAARMVGIEDTLTFD